MDGNGNALLLSTADEQRRALASGEITAHQLACLARERIASLEARFNAVLELNPQAEGIAAALDAERRAGHARGPLHGIPLLLKDNIDTADAMHTSAGSLALAGRYAPRDAHLAAKLRAAGAVLLGKANMTEFANYVSGDMPNGFSSRGGQVRHAWGAGDPSGSSTGSAVAVATGYVPIAIGTETLGSIISPACEAGIVGVKPTVGLISRSGVLPISVSQDTAGPMARSVLDCALALDAMAGPDAGDPATLHSEPFASYAEIVRNAPESLEGYVFGLFNKDEEGKPCAAPAFTRALDALRALGAEIREVKLPPFPGREAGTIFRNEFRACMDAALKGSVGGPATLEEIVLWNRAHAERAIPYGQQHLEGALAPGLGFAHPEYAAAKRAVRTEFLPGLRKVFEENRLTAVITPCCSSFAVAGYPSVCLPVGMEAGRPVSVVLNGTAFSEAALLAVAAALERAVGNAAMPLLSIRCAEIKEEVG